jgi:hypothetical protein
MPIVLKSGNLNLLEPSGPAQASKGIGLSFTPQLHIRYNMSLLSGTALRLLMSISWNASSFQLRPSVALCLKLSVIMFPYLSCCSPTLYNLERIALIFFSFSFMFFLVSKFCPSLSDNISSTVPSCNTHYKRHPVFCSTQNYRSARGVTAASFVSGDTDTYI